MTFEPKLGSTAVVKVTLLLADINDFAKVNEVYKTCKSTGVMIPLMTHFRGYLLVGCLKYRYCGNYSYTVFTEKQPARAAYQAAALPKVR